MSSVTVAGVVGAPAATSRVGARRSSDTHVVAMTRRCRPRRVPSSRHSGGSFGGCRPLPRLDDRTRDLHRANGSIASAAAADVDDDAVRATREACLKVAIDASKLGAGIMLEKLGADVVKTKANTRDLLTEVDPEVQRVIEDAVAAAFPDHGFLGEESVPPGMDASSQALAALLADGPDWLWVVDPIDGTTNFVHGMPLSAISIGVAFRGEMQAAVIMDPFAGEIFSATRGGGAFVNFSPARVGEEATGEEAVVVTGYGATEESADSMIKGMTALTALPVRSVRMLGSAAIMLAWVAAGRLTAYYECDLNSWDTAAGALLVREAGGRITDLTTGWGKSSDVYHTGRGIYSYNVLCSSTWRRVSVYRR